MFKNLIFLTSVVLVLALAGTNVAFGATVESRVAASSDDAEEYVLIDGGKMDSVTSTDLELGYEKGVDLQAVGIRLLDIQIPQGATITSAWVQFSADDINNDYHVPAVSLIIEGELSPNPVTFNSEKTADITSRPVTTASVVWDVPQWMVTHLMGPDEQTPEISAIIQEIINQPDWAAGNAIVLLFKDNPANPSLMGTRESEAFDGEPTEAPLLHIEFEEAGGTTIPVDPNGDIAAANEIAQPGDTIEIAAGTFVLAEQIAIKDGVTYKGAGAGLTIIDGNDVTRAFVAWGDRGATNGQVDANGVGILNGTGPKGWVLDGLTIKDGVADTLDRQDILSAARDLLNNYTGTPYTLETAQTENGSIVSNPEWFDILSGGADNDLTDVELQAYLDANPVGSAGHLVVNDDKSGDGGAITIDNEAEGTIQNCEFLNNRNPDEGAGDDGGAINITGRSVITINNCVLSGNYTMDDGGAININTLSVVTVNDCLFDGNYAVSADSVVVEGRDGDGGHIAIQGGSASALTPGTTLNANRCVFLNGDASDDGGAIRTGAVGSIVRLDACLFEANTSSDNGNVLAIGNEGSGELTVTNCIFANNITADTGQDRMCEVRRNSRFINCTFVGNNQNDEDMIYNNADVADTDADGVDDETADATQVINCIFVNNVMGNGDDVLGSRNASFTIAATNCLFFGNTLQNGNAADNTQRPADETGSVMADPLLDVNHVQGAGSPAIDAGVDPATVGVTLTTDYNGDPRPQGAAYDIGAFESPAN